MGVLVPFIVGLSTIFQWVKLEQLQVQCKGCGHKFYITRKLLGIEPMKRIPAEVYRKLGLVGSLTTYRVAQKIVNMFGWTVDKMTIWKSVQNAKPHNKCPKNSQIK